MKKLMFILLSVLLVGSVALNIYMVPRVSRGGRDGIVSFSDANSRDTYFTVHNVKTAHSMSKGAGVKVGVMDWCFGYSANKALYADAVNFTANKDALDTEHHGFWMATALKEIAPDCEVYGLAITDMDEDLLADNMVKAIDWAIENDLDVLTYSNAPFSEKNRPKIDEAVNKAVEHGIITTFIHYDSPNNLYPDGFFAYSDGGRAADVNILHYDYNQLFLDQYERYQSFNGDYSKIKSGDDVPYLSMSSTSPVLAGFVAILKSINPNLSPAEYKDILVQTSYALAYEDWGFGRETEVPRVADIGKAAEYLLENKVD